MLAPPPLPVLAYLLIQPTFLLGLPAHVGLEQIEITTPHLVLLALAVDTSEATCLPCQQASHRVHSHYTRTLQELACAGKTLLSDNSSCRQKLLTFNRGGCCQCQESKGTC